jgi:hypothetical protein
MVDVVGMLKQAALRRIEDLQHLAADLAHEPFVLSTRAIFPGGLWCKPCTNDTATICIRNSLHMYLVVLDSIISVIGTISYHLQILGSVDWEERTVMALSFWANKLLRVLSY